MPDLPVTPGPIELSAVRIEHAEHVHREQAPGGPLEVVQTIVIVRGVAPGQLDRDLTYRVMLTPIETPPATAESSM